MLHSQTAGLLWVLVYLKVEWETDLSFSDLSSVEQASSFDLGHRKLLYFKSFTLKLSFLVQHVVRARSGDSEPSLSYTAINLASGSFP